MLIYLRLCKSGFASSLNEAKELDARTVIQALSYEIFLDDYERTWVELNK